jgi:hypothetical protein
MFPDLRSRLFAAIQSSGRHNHLCSFHPETEGNGFPDPATASGDHSGFSFQSFHRFPPPSILLWNHCISSIHLAALFN